MTCNQGRTEPTPTKLPRRRVLFLLAAWSLWDLIGACPGGFYPIQAIFDLHFASIFLGPAMVGRGLNTGALV